MPLIPVILPVFNPVKAFDWLSEQTGNALNEFATWTGLKEEEPKVEPAPQGFIVDGAGNRRPIDPETGYPIATSSEAQDIRADIREPAIEALQQEARAMGHELPQDFLTHMRFNENPLFPIPGVDHQVSIFLADGSLNPEVHESIRAQIASGELEKTAEKRVDYRKEHEAGLGQQGEKLLTAVEEMNGKALPAEVKQALIHDRQYEYQDAQGNHRMIDLKQPDAVHMLAEIREMSGQFLNGKSINISDGEAVALQSSITNAIRSGARSV